MSVQQHLDMFFYDQEKREELITWPCALIPVASAINSVSSIPVNQ